MKTNQRRTNLPRLRSGTSWW